MPDPLRTVIELETPDHVQVTFELAGLGRRALATGYDLAIQVLLTIAVGLLALLGLLAFGVGLTDVSMGFLGILILINFVIWQLYFMICELTMNGQTFGKRAARIRVIQKNGASVTLITSLVRNLLRWVDWFPGLYGVGILIVLVSKLSQRLGDVAAGTYVVTQEREDVPNYMLMDPESLSMSESMRGGVLTTISAVRQEDYEYVLRLLYRLTDLAQTNPSMADYLVRRTAGALLRKMRLAPDRGVDYGFGVSVLQMVAIAYARRSVGA